MASLPDRGESTHPLRWLYLAIVPLAAALRFLFLSHKSLWLDETLSVFFARQNWHSFIRILWQGEFNMVSYYALLRVILHLGNSEFWVRLPAALAGVAAIPVMFLLGKSIFGRRVGLLAALVTAVNSCHILYSQEARAYTLLVLFSALSSLLFIKGIERPSAGIWFLYVVINGLAIGSHFFAGLLFLAQWLSLLALPARTIPRKQVGWGIAGTSLLCSPAAFFILTHNVGQLDWTKRPGPGKLFNTLLFFCAEGAKWYGYVVLGFCLAALVWSGCEFWRNRGSEPQLPHWRKLLVWIWLALPISLAFVISLVRTPMFEHRYLLLCLPAFILLVAQGLSLLRSAWVVPVFVGLSLVAVALGYLQKKDDWRESTRAVLSQLQQRDAVCFLPAGGEMAFRYYEERWRESTTAANRNTPTVNLACTVDSPSEKFDRLWLVLYRIPRKLDPHAPVIQEQEHFTSRYPVRQQTDFREVRIMLLDVGHPN